MYVSHPMVERLELHGWLYCTVTLFIRNICLLWLRNVFLVFFFTLAALHWQTFCLLLCLQWSDIEQDRLRNPTAVNFTPDVCFKNDEGAAGASCHMGYFSVTIRFWLISQITPMCVFSSKGFVIYLQLPSSKQFEIRQIIIFFYLSYKLNL